VKKLSVEVKKMSDEAKKSLYFTPTVHAGLVDFAASAE
jgi:hypothetical protein